MAFRMPRPSRRADSRNEQFTQRIPTDLIGTAPGTMVHIEVPSAETNGSSWEARARCGKTHVRLSLGTGERRLAIARQAACVAAVERHWETLRASRTRAEQPPAQLSARQCAALAGEVYRTWQAKVQDEPALRPEEWRRVAAELEQIEKGFGPRARTLIRTESSPDFRKAVFQDKLDRCSNHVAAVLDASGLHVSAETRNVVTERVFEALKFNALSAARLADGDFRPDENAARFPSWERPMFEAPRKSFKQVFEEYALVPGKFDTRSEKTLKRYRAIFIDEFGGFLSSNLKVFDPLSVKKQDIAKWRDKLLADGLSYKTISDVKLAALHAIYRRQVDDGYLPFNPVVTGSTKGKKRLGREQGATDEEAAAILRAALSFKPGKHAQETANAIRWAPFLAAATGARITEICQLRRQDLIKRSDGWWVTITPDAGSVKNGHLRTIPLHSGLLAYDFERFISEAPPGTLFYRGSDPNKVNHHAAQIVGQRVANWIRRNVGIADPRLQPNHGWRHRFATLCREHGIHPEYREVIAGRSKKKQGEEYGEAAGLRREIEKLPASALLPVYRGGII
jgi:integrase